jgi:hypothetical protein
MKISQLQAALERLELLLALSLLSVQEVHSHAGVIGRCLPLASHQALLQSSSEGVWGKQD